MNLRAFLLALIVLAGAAAANAQVFADIGSKVSGSYQGGAIDEVDLFTGNVYGSIPLVSYPQLGKLPPLTFSVNFNTAPFTQDFICDPIDLNCDFTAGRIVAAVQASYQATQMVNQVMPFGSGTPYTTMTDETGNTHHFLQLQESGTQYVWGSTDGSGYMATFKPNDPVYQETTETLYRPDGITIQAASSASTSPGELTTDTISDPNGNTISHQNYGATTTVSNAVWVDSIGRIIPDITWENATLIENTTENPGAASAACPNSYGQLLAYVLQWNPPGPGSSTPTYSFCYGINARLEVIMLPDGTQWGFIWGLDAPGISGTVSNINPYITEIMYPTGATETFSYVNSYTTMSRWPDWGDPNVYLAISQKTLTLPDAETRTTKYSYGTVSGVFPQQFTTTVTDGMNNDTVHTFTDLASSRQPYETQTDVYQGSATGGTLLQSTATTYTYFSDTTVQQYYNSTPPTSVEEVLNPNSINDVLPSQVTVSDSLGQISSALYGYTGYNPGGGSYNYNFKSPTSINVTAAGAKPRQTITTPLYALNAAFAPPTAAGIGTNQLTLPATVQVSDDQLHVVAETEYNYDELPGNATSTAPPPGNLTSVYQWLNTSGAPVRYDDAVNFSDLPFSAVMISQSTYGAYGMLSTTTDGNSNVTALSYSYTASGCYGLFPQSTTVGSGTTLAETTSATYDCTTGQPLTTTDANSVITKYIYDDPLGRLTKVQSAYLNAAESDLSISYNLAQNQVTVTQDQTSTGDGSLTMTSTTNGLGQVISQTGPSGATVKTSYDADGRVASVSSPKFGLYDTVNATSYQYDALGRLTVQGEPDGNTLQRCYNGYPCNKGNASNFAAGRWVDQTDEQGHDWQQVSDGYGQLRRVIEPGPLQTEYEYNTMGNLRHIKQLGTGSTSVERSFGYDTMSHLLWSTNPENGTICYGSPTNNDYAPAPYGTDCLPATGSFGGGYDGVGNPFHKTDANGTRFTYTYDALNRMTMSAAVPWVGPQLVKNYAYDSGTYGVGRLASESVSGTLPATACSLGMACSTITSGAYYTYDALGRTTFKGMYSPTLGWYLPNAWGVVGYGATYDRAGEMTTLHYPDDTVIQQTWTNGNLTGIVNVGTGDTYLASASYGPTGALLTQTLGNGVVENFSYNSRFQQCEHNVQFTAGGTTNTVYDKQFFFQPGATQETLCGNATGNTGSIQSIPDQVNSALSRTFSYDGLNRLASAARADGAFNFTYNIDPFGNMQQTPNGNGYHPTISFTNNQIQVGGSPNYAYDAAGQLLHTDISVPGYHSFTYNPDGQIATVEGGTTAAYFYDAEGNRNLKLTQDSTYLTEYETFQGETYSQLDGYTVNVWVADGGPTIGLPFTDYIYANGSKIAAVQSSGDNYLQVSGSPGAGGTQQWYNLATNTNFATLGELPYAIQQGDTLAWRQWQSATPDGANKANGGILLQMDGGPLCTAVGMMAPDGNLIDADTRTGEWHNRVMDLSIFATNQCTLNSISVGLNTGSTGSGVSADFAEVVLYSPNGAALLTLFNGNGIAYTGALSGNNMPSPLIHYSTRALAGSLPGSTHFFTTDQVGTAQLEFAAGGWPVWQGEFTPYGGAVSASGPTANNYQFTGQERDRETADITNTGLDFMNARYYSSTLGRFTTPDPYIRSIDITNPQSFNRYTYALNNPLSFLDPSGLDCYDINGAPLTPSGDNTQNNCESDGGQWCPADACAYAGSPIPSMPGAPVPTDGLLPESPQQGTSPLFVRNYAPSNPCANATLAATGVNAQANIAQANSYVAGGVSVGSLFGNPFLGALVSYGALVNTGGLQDVKNQPGPGTQQQRVDAGNISFGVTCSFGAVFCQASAGAAQVAAANLGHLTFGRIGHGEPGSWKTYFDSPTDNASIKVGQAMRAAGCR